MKWRHRIRSIWREHVLPWWRDVQWPVIAGLGLAALVLGWVGFKQYFDALAEPRSHLDVLYKALQLFTLESGSVSGPVPWQLEVARLLAPAVAGYMAVKALAVIFREQIERFRMRRASDHIVVCGLGRKGLLLARAFRERGDAVVAVERDEGNDMIEPCRENGAIVLIGDARDRHTLRKSGVQRAMAVISVCGDDGVNAEVAVHTRELARQRNAAALTCLAHIVDPRLCTLLRVQEVAAGREGSLPVDFFNVFESGARALLEEHRPFRDSAGSESPHMLVVGLGNFGESLLIQAARLWKTARTSAALRLRVTIIDRVARARKDSLCFRYPQLADICDLEVHEIDIHSPDFEKADQLFDQIASSDVSCIYVCLDDDSAALSAALTMRRQLQEREIPIVVRMMHEAGLGILLEEKEGGAGGFEGLHAFGLLERTCKPDLLFGGTHEVLARAIHEDYVRRQSAAKQTREANPSMVAWDELPESLKESNRRQASHIGVKLRAIGCILAPLTDFDADNFPFAKEEVELLAEMEHERFMAERLAAGWTRVDGPKSIDNGTSPSLVPWAKLSPADKEKNRDTVRRIPGFLAEVGFQIVRLRSTERR